MDKNVSEPGHLISTVIQYNSEKLVEDDLAKIKTGVINYINV